MIARYLVFAFADYYPGGGWADFEQAFISFNDAKAFALTKGPDKVKNIHGKDNVHIVDTMSLQIVWKHRFERRFDI
jgi:hypothetical protein